MKNPKIAAAAMRAMRAMKAERLGELLSDPVWDQELSEQVSGELFLMVMRYILDTGVDKDGFMNKVGEIREPGIRSEAMTIAQQLRQEGLHRGRQEGIVEALELRFDRIPDGLREAVRSVQDGEKLQVLHRAAIQCTTLEEFSESL